MVLSKASPVVVSSPVAGLKLLEIAIVMILSRLGFSANGRQPSRG